MSVDYRKRLLFSASLFGSPLFFSAVQAQVILPVATAEPEPGIVNVVGIPITPEEAERVLAARVANSIASPAPSKPAPEPLSLRTGGGSAAPGVASIADMARALKYDPDLIYEYVRNNIEFIPMFGIKKGAVGALIDGSGTSADQAELMVQLLAASAAQNPAIVNPKVVLGRIRLNPTQFMGFMGLSSPPTTTNICESIKYGKAILGTTGGAIVTQTSSCSTNANAVNVSTDLDHFWVKVAISGTEYIFDPAFKTFQVKPRIDLAAAMSYVPSNFLTSAVAGATTTADYVQNINRANVRNSLTAYSNNLIAYLRQNKPSADLDDIVGGKTIVPYNGSSIRQLSHPNLLAASTPIDFTGGLTDAYRPKLNVKIAVSATVNNINQTFLADQLAGKRLSLTFVFNAGKYYPQLRLDGVLVQAGATGYAANQLVNIDLTPMEIYAVTTLATSASKLVRQPVKAGNSYVVSNSWGISGRGPIEVYRKALQAETDRYEYLPDQPVNRYNDISAPPAWGGRPRSVAVCRFARKSCVNIRQ
jgi:hypothetical protein